MESIRKEDIWIVNGKAIFDSDKTVLAKRIIKKYKKTGGILDAKELQEWFDTFLLITVVPLFIILNFMVPKYFPFDGDTREEAHLKATNYIIERLNGGTETKMTDEEKISFLKRTMNVMTGWALVDISE